VSVKLRAIRAIEHVKCWRIAGWLMYSRNMVLASVRA
jgi:hypothetical protein